MTTTHTTVGNTAPSGLRSQSSTSAPTGTQNSSVVCTFVQIYTGTHGTPRRVASSTPMRSPPRPASTACISTTGATTIVINGSADTSGWTDGVSGGPLRTSHAAARGGSE